MKKELMDILACPMCRGDLELSVDEEEEGKGEIVKGRFVLPKMRPAVSNRGWHT